MDVGWLLGAFWEPKRHPKFDEIWESFWHENCRNINQKSIAQLMKNHSFSKIVKMRKIARHAGENAKIKVREGEMSSRNGFKNVSKK